MTLIDKGPGTPGYDHRDEIEHVREMVRAAFTEAPMPVGEDLINYDGLEEEDIIEVFYGKAWRELTAEELWSASPTPIFMSDVGWRYYLPAFILFRLDPSGDSVGHPVVDLFGLALWAESRQLRERWRTRIALLTEREREAVKAYVALGLYTDDPEIREAWDTYWSKV